jgi:anti-anti-sigma factor
MQLSHSEVDGITRIDLDGRLDTAGVGAVELQFIARTVPGAKPVIVDLSKVSFLASLGVRMFITTARSHAAKGGRMALFGATEEVAEIIQTMGLDEVVPVVPTEHEAIAYVRG